MGRLLTGLAGALGLEAADDRDEFDAAEGQPVDQVGRPPLAAEPQAEAEKEREVPVSLDERRRAIHEKAQQALGEMGTANDDD